MSLLDALLGDIKDNPDDDTPRLVLADWLMEQDDPALAARGEFVRVQCLLARAARRAPELGGLVRRQWELEQAHAATWLGPLASAGTCCFRRGLVSISVPAASLGGEALAELVGDEAWAWVYRLQVIRGPAEGVSRLVGAPHLRLTGLDLPNNSLGPVEVGELVTSFHRHRLTELDLSLNPPGDEAAKALADSPDLRRLTTLTLNHAQVGDAGARALAGSPHLRCLHTLVLFDNSVGPEGAKALADSADLALTTLDLADNRVGDEGVLALASSPHMADLTELDLRRNGIGAEGALALAGSSHLGRLTALFLYTNPISPRARSALRERFGRRVYF
jgi:uncharacterized protein (TIGR02996 family)